MIGLRTNQYLSKQFNQLNFKNIMNLFIQAKSTPNPNFLKFVPSGKTVMTDGTSLDFIAARYAHVSPLAKKLFTIDGVNRVFYGKDYISISKKEEADWNELKPQIFSLITEQFTGTTPLFTDDPEREDTKIKDDDSEAVQMIKEIIDTRIRPLVQDDGGDVIYRNFDEPSGIVTLTMMGSCSGCPSSQVTLKQGIEKMIMHYVPEVNGVESVDYGENEQPEKKSSA
ncbi:hypothetical protein ABPG72_000013 [Tetrahymena utriculariae]